MKLKNNEHFSVFLLILLVHHWLWHPSEHSEYVWMITVQPILVNPVFLGIIMTVLALGDVFCLRWLDRCIAIFEK